MRRLPAESCSWLAARQAAPGSPRSQEGGQRVPGLGAPAKRLGGRRSFPMIVAAIAVIAAMIIMIIMIIMIMIFCFGPSEAVAIVSAVEAVAAALGCLAAVVLIVVVALAVVAEPCAGGSSVGWAVRRARIGVLLVFALGHRRKPCNPGDLERPASPGPGPAGDTSPNPPAAPPVSFSSQHLPAAGRTVWGGWARRG